MPVRGSSLLSPRSSAKWLRVPAEMHTNGRSCAIAIDATSACDPSPPAMPRQSAPLAIASYARSARSRPWSRKTVSTPRSSAIFARSNFSTLPPPDHGLHNSTGLLGLTLFTPCRRSSSWRSGTRAARAVTVDSATSPPSTRIQTNAASALVAANTTARQMTTAPATIPAIPTARRGLRSVTVHQPPPASIRRPTSAPTRKTSACASSRTSTTTTANAVARETIAADLRAGLGTLGRVAEVFMAAPPRKTSHPLERLDPGRADRGRELREVPLVLLRVALGEVGDRPVERVVFAEVGGDRDGVAGAGMGARQRPSAEACVVLQRLGREQLHHCRALHVAELPPVEVTIRLYAPGPAQEYVAGGLHQPLALHDAFPGLTEPAPLQWPLQHRPGGLLNLEEQRVVCIPAL